MRNGLYYLVALLLLLATVPMYRYVIEHSSREAVNQVRSLAGPPPIDVESLRRPIELAGFKTFYAYDEPLPEGYKCSGAGGSVYRTRSEGGAVVLDPLYVGGQLVRCGGDESSSIR